MGYILVDSALLYMLESFPRKAVPELFNAFCDKCDGEEIICEKETKKSLENLLEEESSFEWIKEHNKLFRAINQKESALLGELVKEGLFSLESKSSKIQRNIPITIPFVLTIAIHEERTVVVDKKATEWQRISKLCHKKGVNLLAIDDFLAQIKA